MLGCTRVYGQAPLPPAAGEMSRPARQPHEVYLTVELNGQPTALIVEFRERGGKLAASGRDLDQIGLATDRLGIAATAEVPLDSVRGLTYDYDEARQSVALQAVDGIRKPYTFDTRAQSQTVSATSAQGLAINYDLFAQSDSDQQLAWWSEERYFDRNGVFSNTGVAYLYRNQQSYLRYDTSWSRSNPATLDTIQVGDLVSSSLAWSRSIRMGGVQWRSNFSLRPDLVTFPVPALAGSAVVPSSVDLYIDNVRQFSGTVPSGPFIVNDVPSITGGGQATVITHDALGRTVATSVPLYVDARLLAPGLSSYSLEAGFLRRDYGVGSFDYNPRPAASGSVRYGVDDFLTLEGHAEATGGLYNAGGGALVRLGMAGVVNGALAASSGRLAGTQLSLGYQLIEPRFAVDAQTLRAFGNYGDLGARDGTPVATVTDSVTLTLPVIGSQTVLLSYIGSKFPLASSSQIGSLAYTLNLSRRVSLNLSGYNDFKQRNSRGAYLSLSLELGDKTSINASMGRQNGQANNDLDAVRPPDYEGGWGWGVQNQVSGGQPYRQAQAQYLGRDGEVSATAQQVAGHTNATLDLSGAVVLMDRSVQLSRQIDDSFALVATDGVAGIPVLHENRVIGSTDQAGHFLIPDLNAYQANQVGIDSMNLPVDTRIATTSMTLIPQARSGVLAHFGVTQYRAASVILHTPDGKVLPPGARVHHRESGRDTIVGYDGLTFIDGLQADNHLTIDDGSLHCGVEFAYRRPRHGGLPTIGPLVCRTQGAPRP